MKLRISAAAETHLSAIERHIAADNPRAASTVLVEIRRAADFSPTCLGWAARGWRGEHASGTFAAGHI